MDSGLQNIALWAGIVAAAAQVVGLVLVIFQIVLAKQAMSAAAAGTRVSATQVVQLAAAPPPTEIRVKTTTVSQSRDMDLWEIVGLILLVGAAFAIVVSLYLTYRLQVFLTIGTYLAAAVILTVVGAVVLRRLHVVGHEFAVGWVLMIINLTGSLMLLLVLWTRSTPFGSYEDVTKRVLEAGYASLIATGESRLLRFFTAEILALVYVVLITAMLTVRQMATLALINASLRQRSPGFLGRVHLGPKKPSGIWGVPLVGCALLAIAWVLSSEWFFYWSTSR